MTNVISQFPKVLNFLLHALIFVVAIVAYTATMNGDVQPADSGEFQIAAITLGIPHPPGYPLFTMLGWLFAQAPIDSPFARVSFLSVIASALSLVLVSLTAQRVVIALGGRVIALLAGLTAAVALGASTTFWAQATTTNIRSLTAFFTALMLYASARAFATRKSSSLVLFALAAGFGIGHHVSLIFIGAVLGVYVLLVVWRDDRAALPRTLLTSALIFAATQLVWLYLPLRDSAGARFAPGNLNTLDGLLFHIFARGFAGDMLAFAAPEYLFDRLALLPTLLVFQLSWPLWIGAVVGVAVLLWRRAGVALAWLIAFALHLLITITYRAPQTVEYALPCWVIACTALGAGLGALGAGRKAQDAGRKTTLLRLASCVLLIMALIVAVGDGAWRWPSFVYLGRDRSTRADAEAVLRDAQPGGAILSQWHQATPMWALQDVEGLRRDALVDYVFPRGAQPYAETFAQQAAQAAKRGLAYATSNFGSQFATNGLESAPLPGTPAWRVAPSIPMPNPASPKTIFDDRIQVIWPLGIDGSVLEAGQAVPVDVWWSIQGDAHAGDSLTVRLMRPDGRLAANADLSLSEVDGDGNWRAKRLILGLPLDLPPGEYDVMVGAYRAADTASQFKDEAGREFTPVARVRVAPASQPPATQRPMNDAITNGARLIGVDYDTGIPGQLRAWTHWQLGAEAVEINLQDASGPLLAAPKQLPAATNASQPQYFSLPFDVPPTRRLLLSTGQRLPDFADGERYVPFANQMALTGSSAHRNGPSLKVDLHWLAARPLTRDYIVSARVEGDGLYQTHDSVPALGAIPTLKWIRGSRVMDRHPVTLGDYAGPLRGSVVVYDSASQLPLPPLDERYENGVTIPIE